MIYTEEVVSITLSGSPVAKIEDTRGNILWEFDYANSYFYVKNPGSSTITLSILQDTDSGAPDSLTVQKLGPGDSEFTTWGTTSQSLTMSLGAGQSVQLRSTMTERIPGETEMTTWKDHYIQASGPVEIGGNIMSLVAGQNYINAKDLSNYDSCFARLFSAPDMYFDDPEIWRGFTPTFNVSDISRLTLPAETLSPSGTYYGMFRGCTRITTIPRKFIRAINGITDTSCAHMFNGCTGLTTISSGAISNPGSVGYLGMASMFKGCTGLTSLPSNLLGATTVGSQAYYYMFSGCTGLTTIPSAFLPATTLGTGCYYGMFNGCTGLTNGPALPVSGTLPSNAYYNMFYGCTSLQYGPALPANNIGTGSYTQMFYGCTSLRSPSIMSCTTVPQNGCRKMYCGCTSLTIPQGFVLPVNIGNQGASEMFSGCTSITSLPDGSFEPERLDSQACQNMFQGCTALTQANLKGSPTLNGSNTFLGMFSGCTSLNSIKCNFITTTSDSGQYSQWVRNVAASGTFYYYPGSSWARGENGIPMNWQAYNSDPWTEQNLRVYNNGSESTNLKMVLKKQDGTRLNDWSGIESSFTYYIAIQYRLQGGAWSTKIWSRSATPIDLEITVPAGEYVEFRHSSATQSLGKEVSINYNGTIISPGFECTSPVSIAGNATSMTGLKDTDEAEFCYAIPFLFSGLTITSLTNLRLPWSFNSETYKVHIGSGTSTSDYKSVGYGMYEGLFKNCVLPERLPANFLPSEYIPGKAYYEMFANCTGLKEVNRNLFRNGASCTFTPYYYRPFGTSAAYGQDQFGRMFAGSSVESVGDFLRNIHAWDAYYGLSYMFQGCTGLTDCSDLSIKYIYTQNGTFYGMFKDCTNLVKSPRFYDSAMRSSYRELFSGCSSLNEIWAYFNPTQGWDGSTPNLTDFTNGVAETGTFHYKTGTTWPRGTDGIPTGWTAVAETLETPLPFYLKSSTDNTYTISWVEEDQSAEIPVFDIYYSTDNVIWSLLGSTEEITSETPLSCAGRTIYLKADTPSWTDYDSNGLLGYLNIDATNNFSIGGNIMSLLEGESYGESGEPGDYALSMLFANSIHLIGATNLSFSGIGIVGSRSFEKFCYNAVNLVNAPSSLFGDVLELDGDYCFKDMFRGSGITRTYNYSTPKTIISNGSVGAFEGMFSYITSITTIDPRTINTEELRGTATDLFKNMFVLETINNTALNVKEMKLALDPIPEGAYYGLFKNRNISKSPTLEAAVVGENGYRDMFSGCSNLSEITCFATTLDTNATTGWATGVNATGTFFYKDLTIWTTGSANGIPSGWTTTEFDWKDFYFYVKNTGPEGINLTVKRQNSYVKTKTEQLQYSTNGGVSWTGIGFTANEDSVAKTLTLQPDVKYSWRLTLAAERPAFIELDEPGLKSTSVIEIGGNPRSMYYTNDSFKTDTTIDMSRMGPQYWGFGNNKNLGYNKSATTINLSSFFSGNSLNAFSTNKISYLTAPIPSWFYDILNIRTATTIELNSTFRYYIFENGLIPQQLSTALSGLTASASLGSTFSNSNLVEADLSFIPTSWYDLSACFWQCTSLRSVSGSLPGSSLADKYYDTGSGCAGSMFSGCTSLTTVPSDLLPATTLNKCCYSNMFSNCSSLTSGPDLPATSMVGRCYSGMFSNCTSLTSVKIYATNPEETFAERYTSSVNKYYTGWNDMFNGVSTQGTLQKPSGITYPVYPSTYGNDTRVGIPTTWTQTNLPRPQKDTFFWLKNTGLENSSINLTHTNGGMMWEPLTLGYVYYSTDQTTWIQWGRYTCTIDEQTMEASWSGGTSGALTLTPGSTLYFYCSGEMFAQSMGGMDDEMNGQYFTMSGGNIQAGGNIWSMRLGQNFANQTDLMWNLGPLFKNCSVLTNIDQLVIAYPGTTIGANVFSQLFSYTGITSIPSGFFNNITTIGSSNSATGYGTGCFKSMFQGCRSLTTINGSYLFPSFTITDEGYQTGDCNSIFYSMFLGCTNLRTIPERLFNTTWTIPGTVCSGMFQTMFFQCTSLTSTPEINVANGHTLRSQHDASSVFSDMFYGCTSLNEVKAGDNTSWLYNGAANTAVYSGWLNQVAAAGTFRTTTSSVWTLNSSNGIPSGWTRVNS